MLFSKQQNIANYTVAFPIKEGAYAETYRVKDVSGKNRFLKLINYAKIQPSQIDDNGRVNEIEILKNVRHPNICNYVDSGEVIIQGQKYAYFVTDFIAGETVAQKVTREQKCSVYDTKQIAITTLKALKYLHGLPCPVIHNEVTSQNLMLDLTKQVGDLKLIDFGNARYFNQPLAKPKQHDLNPFYMAPERFNGVSSIQSDLYSVGVMIYHLLYGKLPWFIDLSNTPPNERIDSILAQREKLLDIPSLDLFELDSQFINTFKKAMSFNVEDRFQTADEFIKAINGEIIVGEQECRRKIKNGGDDGNATKYSKPAKGEGFAAIAGMDALKKQMKRDVIDVLHNPEKCRKYGLTIPNGMLLYGPPGCGKTFFAKHFAEEVGFNFMAVTPGTLKSKWVNATEENIAKMFKEAEEKAPTIIFIDEISGLFPKRDSDAHEMSRNATEAMLAEMDRTGEKNIFVICATNHPELIDDALLRTGRLDKKFFLPPPDFEARKLMFEMYFKRTPEVLDFGLDYDQMASLTDNYISSDISAMVLDAKRIAYNLDSKITMRIILDVISQTKPSITKDTIMKYELIRREIEGESIKNGENEKGTPRIGFKK